MIPEPLTDRQREVLDVALKHIQKEKDFPSFRTIMRDMGFASPNTVTQNIKALHRKGYLIKTGKGYNLARAEFFLSPKAEKDLRDLMRRALLQLEKYMRKSGEEELHVRKLSERYRVQFEDILSREAD